MSVKPITILLLALGLWADKSFAQEEDILNEIETDEPVKEYVNSAFKSSRVIMAHSMEMLNRGVLDFRILHRFGRINGGASEFFGLDGPATVRLGLDYGLTDDLTLGLGRSSFNKDLDGFVKYRILHQSTGRKAMPFSLLAAVGTSLTTQKWADPHRKNYFTSRMVYFGQLILGRKFSESLTLQIMPSVVHRNLVPLNEDPNDLFTAGVGGRLKLSRRLSFNVDYHYRINPNDAAGYRNPLSLGFDIETGGHVFQLHFTNSKGMNERAFLSATEYNWADGDIFFGFNISRTFQVRR